MESIRLDDPFYSFLTQYGRMLSKGKCTPEVTTAFCKTVWNYYHTHKRIFAWRQTTDPYSIVVSEIMLQQTQTQRVAEKYEEFLSAFPTFDSLAHAPTSEVLKRWVGLGYNRRALALQGIAQKVVNEYGGQLPTDPVTLQTFKGLGPATASSIVTFAFNVPTIFIETNIRAVYLHAFFRHEEEVHDKQLLPFIALTVDQQNPREWYYALMDCGVLLKKLYKNPSRKSKHHTQQSKFEGSDRQLRGAVIRLCTQKGQVALGDLQVLSKDVERVSRIVADLEKEGFLEINKSIVKIAHL